MNTFSKEAEIAYMEICNDIEISKDLSEISYLEEGGNPPRSRIGLIIDKLVALIDKAINKIKEFFTGKRTKDSIDKIEKAIDNDPSLRNKKIKIKNYDKLRKLQDDTFDKIDKCKTSEDVNKLRKFYQEHKKIIIGAGAVTMVSVGSILAYLKSGKSKDEDRLKHKRTNLITKIANERKAEKEEKERRKEENERRKKESKGFELLDRSMKIEKDHTASINPSLSRVESYQLHSEVIKDCVDVINECEKVYGIDAIKEIMNIETRYKKDTQENHDKTIGDIELLEKRTKTPYPTAMDRTLRTLKIADKREYKNIVKKYTK